MQKPEEFFKGFSSSTLYLIRAYEKYLWKIKTKQCWLIALIYSLYIMWNDIYPVEEDVSPNSSHLAAVIQTKIRFCCSKKTLIWMFPNLLMKSLQTSALIPLPNASLILWVWSLSFCRFIYLWCVAEVMHNFTYVLYDSDIIFSAVVPELRCRKFTTHTPTHFPLAQKNNHLPLCSDSI